MGILPFPWLVLLLVGYAVVGWQLAGWPLSPRATLMVSLGLAVALPLFLAFLKWLSALLLVAIAGLVLSLLVWPLLSVAWELAALWLSLLGLAIGLKLVDRTVRKISLALVWIATASLGLSLGLLGRFVWEGLQTLWLLWQMG